MEPMSFSNTVFSVTIMMTITAIIIGLCVIFWFTQYRVLRLELKTIGVPALVASVLILLWYLITGFPFDILVNAGFFLAIVGIVLSLIGKALEQGSISKTEYDYQIALKQYLLVHPDKTETDFKQYYYPTRHYPTRC